MSEFFCNSCRKHKAVSLQAKCAGKSMCLTCDTHRAARIGKISRPDRPRNVARGTTVILKHLSRIGG